MGPGSSSTPMGPGSSSTPVRPGSSSTPMGLEGYDSRNFIWITLRWNGTQKSPYLRMHFFLIDPTTRNINACINDTEILSKQTEKINLADFHGVGFVKRSETRGPTIALIDKNRNGIYLVVVQNYFYQRPKVNPLSESGATINIEGLGVNKKFNCSYKGNKNSWHVCIIDFSKGSRSKVQIKEIGKIDDLPTT